MSSQQVKRFFEDIEQQDEDYAHFEANFSPVFDMETVATTTTRHGGSRPGKSANIERDRVGGHIRLMVDYFDPNPRFGAKTFRRRFRMLKGLFHRICSDLEQHDEYFVQKLDRAKKPGFSALQKVTAALRMLAHGTPENLLDENFADGREYGVGNHEAFLEGHH